MCRFSSFVGMLVMLRHPEIEDLGKNVSNFFFVLENGFRKFVSPYTRRVGEE